MELTRLAAGRRPIIGLNQCHFCLTSSGNADFLRSTSIMYIPNLGEACAFFAISVYRRLRRIPLYNAFPAQVFMGDTGSLIAGWSELPFLALTSAKECFLPLMCGIFLHRDDFVMNQKVNVSYFQYTKRDTVRAKEYSWWSRFIIITKRKIFGGEDCHSILDRRDSSCCDHTSATLKLR